MPDTVFDVDPRTNLAIIDVPANKQKEFEGLRGGVLHRFDYIAKVNAKRKTQDRILLTTANYLYFCDASGGVNRNVPIADLLELWRLNEDYIVLRFASPTEYDALFKIKDASSDAFIDALDSIHSFLHGAPLSVYDKPDLRFDNAAADLRLERPKDYPSSVQPVAPMSDIVKWQRDAEEKAAKDAAVEAAEARVAEAEAALDAMRAELRGVKAELVAATKAAGASKRSSEVAQAEMEGMRVQQRQLLEEVRKYDCGHAPVVDALEAQVAAQKRKLFALEERLRFRDIEVRELTEAVRRRDEDVEVRDCEIEELAAATKVISEALVVGPNEHMVAAAEARDRVAELERELDDARATHAREQVAMMVTIDELKNEITHNTCWMCGEDAAARSASTVVTENAALRQALAELAREQANAAITSPLVEAYMRALREDKDYAGLLPMRLRPLKDSRKPNTWQWGEKEIELWPCGRRVAVPLPDGSIVSVEGFMREERRWLALQGATHHGHS